MNQAIETVLQERARQLAGRIPRLPSLLVSAVLHVLVLSSVVIAPLVALQEPEPIEFVPVMIVPVQALGVPTPASAPAPAREAPAPPADSQQESVETEPERPVLPAPDTKPQETRREVSDAPRPKAPAQPSAARAGGGLGQRQGSPLGSTLGTSMFGAAVGGLDNPDFVYSYYIDQMLAMISANWNRPNLGGAIEAMVHFRIHRDGRISEVRVVQSSGYNSFDLAGLRAVQLAAPFPKLPQSYRHGSLGVNLILR